MDCKSCPWGPFPRKGMTEDEFEQYRSKAKAILGYMPIKTACVTCETPDAKIPEGVKLPNRKCLIRQCVDRTGIANCAYCSSFPCDTLKATADAWNRKTIGEKLEEPLSEEDYHVFVEPFEGISRLKAIRTSLKPEEIKEPARIQKTNLGIVAFPEKLPFSEKEISAFKAVHGLLANLHCSSLGFQDADTFSQYHKLENRRANVLRFLWILGSYGKLSEDKKAYLWVDARTFLANRGNEKTLAVWYFLKDTVFRILAEFGVCCNVVALKGFKETDFITGTGYLRNEGWVINVSFDVKAGESASLKALQIYTQTTNKKFGKKAFQRFKEANMQILSEKNIPKK